MISTSLLAVALFMQATTTDTTATDTLGRVVPLPAVVVSTTRLEAASPYARSTMDRADIDRVNWGQDTPMALSTLPGVYAYSDAGNGIGYSYLFIRGFPQRRISVLVNGVPLNDPESHEVYWIDHPDLLASTAEAQVQRGVGSALYGAASVGGSVSLETMPLAAAPTFRAAAGFGSFDTKRVMIEGVSGPLASGWNLYGRYSRIESDGYRDRSDTKLWSYALSVQHAITANQWSRINLYGGPEETHLAYLGIPQSYLDGGITGDADRDRRHNPITYEGERDHFFEPHYELLHHWAISPTVNLSQTFFYFDGEGFYDERRLGQSLSDYRLSPWATSDSTLFPRHYYAQDTTGALVQDGSGNFTVERFDAVRKRFIRNRHYGWVPRLQLRRDAHTLTVGGELRAHDGRHIGSVISGSGLPPGTEPDHVYYDYHPRTLSTGLFMREEWSPSASLAWTLDLAWRHQGYFMRGDQFDGIEFDQSYDFGLPRLGVRWRPRADLTLFAAAGHSRREPAFRDLYDAEGAGSVPLFANGEPLVEPERVMDYEAGVSWTSARAQLGANLFRMDFEDELVYAGQFNTDLGYPILGNAARSVHQGIELTAAAGAPGSPLLLTANATLSDNHFVEYREHHGPTPSDEVSYDGNAIGFFPGALANASARAAWRNATLEVAAQYAGRMYLDNTESKDASIGPRTVVNLNAGWRFSTPAKTSAELALRVFNLLDRRYATSGYMDYDAGGNLVPQFIPAATRHWLAELRLGF